MQGRPAVFRLVRELSPVISTAAAGFHTSRLGGRAMGGVGRRDAVVVARRSQPALENTPAWIHVSTVLGLGASWRGNALVRSRGGAEASYVAGLPVLPSVLQPAGSAF